MSTAENVIEVEGLGKSYRIGAAVRRSTSMVESARNALRAPFRYFSERRAPASKENTIWALKDISFTVRKGEVLGIIGRNGAGKSTLLKILSRITDPTTGRAIVRGRVNSLLEVGTGFHEELTGRENIYMNAALHGMKRREIEQRLDDIIAFSGVAKFIDTPVKRYSSGMRVRLGFAVAAHLDPEVLIVDEVLAVGDFAFQRKCLGKMEGMAGHGRTVIYVSHQMESVEHLCSRCILLQDGGIAAAGPTLPVIERYLEANLSHAAKSLRDRSDREGDGRLRFVNTWVEDGKGRRVRGVRSGDNLVLVGEYELTGMQPVENVVVAFALYGKGGVQITDLGNHTTGDFFAGPIPGRGLFRCSIPKLPLNSGVYTYNMISRSGSAIEDFILGAGTFEVEPGDYFGTGKTVDSGQGMLLIGHRWYLDGEITDLQR